MDGYKSWASFLLDRKDSLLTTEYTWYILLTERSDDFTYGLFFLHFLRLSVYTSLMAGLVEKDRAGPRSLRRWDGFRRTCIYLLNETNTHFTDSYDAS